MVPDLCCILVLMEYLFHVYPVKTNLSHCDLNKGNLFCFVLVCLKKGTVLQVSNEIKNLEDIQT